MHVAQTSGSGSCRLDYENGRIHKQSLTIKGVDTMVNH